MICIKQRDQNVDVQQRPHGSHAFLIDQFSDVIESDHVAAPGENRHCIFRPFRDRCCRQRPSSEGGNHFACRGLLFYCEFLGSLKNVVVDVDCGAHASDDSASNRLSIYRGGEACSLSVARKLSTFFVFFVSLCKTSPLPENVAQRRGYNGVGNAAF